MSKLFVNNIYRDTDSGKMVVFTGTSETKGKVFVKELATGKCYTQDLSKIESTTAD